MSTDGKDTALFRHGPSALAFGADGKELFRITSDGDVILPENVTLTQAAQAFWAEVERLRPERF